MNKIHISLIVLFFSFLTFFSPLMVWYYEAKVQKRIDSDRLLVDPDWATVDFYSDYCGEHNLTERKVCKQAIICRKRYIDGLANVKVLGF